MGCRRRWGHAKRMLRDEEKRDSGKEGSGMRQTCGAWQEWVEVVT